MNVLVTGANGFLGRNLVRILARTHKVLAFDIERSQLETDLDFIEGDLRDFDCIYKALKNIEAVVHLAAVTATPAKNKPIQAMDVNVKGTYNLAEAAVRQGAGRIVFASSIAAYGCLSETFVPQYLPIDEEHPCQPQDTYGLSKFLGEEILKAYTRREALTTICLRFNWAQDSGSPDFQAPSYSGAKTATFWSTIDFRDVLQALTLALEGDIKGNEIFNIASENTWTKQHAADLIMKHYADTTVDDNYFSDNPNRCFFNVSKAKRILGFRPEYELRRMNTNKE